MVDSQERARLQTADEWGEELQHGVAVLPAATRRPVLVYDSHRTTSHGRLILSFADTATGEEIVAFFNVDLHIQRGKDRGKFYRAGQSGQFFPPPRSKFRKFWLVTVGSKPRRWAAVHRELRARLKGKRFTAEVSLSIPQGSREPFLIARNVRIWEQFCDNSATTREQFRNKKKEQGNDCNTDNMGVVEELNRPATKAPLNPVTQ